MFNPKMVFIASVAGFVLSFLIGIFAGVGIGYILLRAFLAAVCFGLLAGAAFYIYVRFLGEGGSDAGAYSKDTAAQPGSSVDITLADEDLQKEDGDPLFRVTDADISSGGASAPVSQKAFNPVSLGAVPAAPETRGGADAVSDEPADSTAKKTDVSENGLDELPDMNSFISGGDDEDVIAGSDAPESRASLIASVSNFSAGSGKTEDTKVLAQAVRTILSGNS